MSRLRTSVGVALLSSIACGPARPPNVVFIVVDTLRADHLPFHGYVRDTAPFLTQLAARSVVFERHQSTSSWTLPAAASLFTSLYPPQHGLVSPPGKQRMEAEGIKETLVPTLPSAIETLPEALRRAGYATFGVSDNAHVAPFRGFARGFDRFEDASDVGAEIVNKRVKKWKAEMLASQPYFLYLHYMEPHMPYLPQGPWYQEYEKDGKVPELLGETRIAAYDSEINFVDERIKGLFESLGWQRDTILILTSDHGEELGDHGRAGHARTLHGEVLAVPLLVLASDGRFAPRRVAVATSGIDLFPTLSEIVGLAPAPQHEGRSLVSLLRTGEWGAAAPRYLYAHLRTFSAPEPAEYTGVIWEQWKLIRPRAGAAMLFDIRRDPDEESDLAAEAPDVVAGLSSIDDRFSDEAVRYLGDTTTYRLDSPNADRLRALGYVQ